MPYIKTTYSEMKISVVGKSVAFSDQDKFKVFVTTGIIGATMASVISARFPRYENVLIVTHLLIGVCLFISGIFLHNNQEILSLVFIGICNIF